MYLNSCLIVGMVLVLTGCSTIRRTALSGAASVFTGDSAQATFMSEEDPELIRDALPFALKTTEILSREDPKNPVLKLAVGRMCVQYANAFLDMEADYLQDEDYLEARDLRRRASKMYWKGRGFLCEALDLLHPGFKHSIGLEPENVLSALNEQDVPYLYWCAAAWAGSIKTDPGNLSRVADLPVVKTLIHSALSLDPEYDAGALHVLMISLEGGLGKEMGGNPAAARRHFDEAVRLSDGQQASPYLSLAESVAIAEQDIEEFKELVEAALAVDPDARPEWRLQNVLSHRRALWLLNRMPELFFTMDEEVE